MTQELTFRPVKPEEGAELLALLADAGFLPEELPQTDLCRLLDGSAVQLGCFQRGRLVGFGRALSDGASDAYLQDVAVLKTARGNGIGAALVRKLVEALSVKGVDWIGLVSVPEATEFYRKLGFKEMAGHVPMKLEQNGDAP